METTENNIAPFGISHVGHGQGHWDTWSISNGMKTRKALVAFKVPYSIITISQTNVSINEFDKIILLIIIIYYIRVCVSSFGQISSEYE